MAKVYLITDEQVITAGHGEYRTVKKLSTFGGYDFMPYPAFKSKEDAEKFMSRAEGNSNIHSVTEIDIWE